MALKSYVVMGEAPESGSEEEIDSSSSGHCVNQRAKVKKERVAGEALESDDDTCGETGSLESVSSAVSAYSSQSLGEKKTKKPKHSSKSLLEKKLYERNASLCKNINDFVSQTVANGYQEMNATNQQLVKCQVQLQEASDILRVLNNNINQLENKLQGLLSTSYLPDINIC